MKIGFNPAKAGDFKACLQFNFTGEVSGKCYIDIKNGTIETAEGAAAQPNLIINTPFEVWMDIMTQKSDGAKMFIEQKYTAEGDMNILIEMGKLFGEG
jgi:putative sterol carrier protein